MATLGMALSETQKKKRWLNGGTRKLYWTSISSWTSVERWTRLSVACRSSFFMLTMTLPDFDSFFLCKESRNPPLCSTLGTSVANLVLSLFEANSCPVAIQWNSLGEVILEFFSKRASFKYSTLSYIEIMWDGSLRNGKSSPYLAKWSSVLCFAILLMYLVQIFKS